ncbi:MAG: Verru_Chthon cassette protein C [Verrucomicrobiota bacterium]
MSEQRRKKFVRGFTLVELMVAMSIFSVLIVIIVQMLGQTQKVANDVSSKVSRFKEARAGFDAIIQRVNQATLNTYWDYDDPNKPTDYVAQSELHFLNGQGPRLIRSDAGTILSHAVFFQAPLGFSTDPDIREFSNLLNAWGFYVEYGEARDYLPAFIASHKNYEPRFRHRLMEFRQAAEDLTIYEQNRATGDYTRWYQDRTPVSNRILAENIILLLIHPMRPEADRIGNPERLAPFYDFDSRNHVEYRHQLPPVIRITMVAIAEVSAIREDFGPEGPGFFSSGVFTDAGRYEEDMAELESTLEARKIDYRVFSTSVPMQTAKWKAPETP